MDDINDIRNEKQFALITFSGYKKSDAIKKFVNACVNNHKEEAFYWSAELICAGHFRELWDSIFKVMYTNIYTSHIKLPVYIETRLNEFRKIINDTNNTLSLRNNHEIRLLFVEISIVLCQSPKRHVLQPIKISPDDLHISKMSHKMNAKNTNYIKHIFKPDDPPELFIALNEFAFNILKDRSYHNATYWLEWLLLYERKTKKTKKLFCTKRHIIATCTDQQSQDYIWIVWEIILKASEQMNEKIKRIIQSLLHIFALRYSSGVKNKRKLILYFTVMLLCDNVDDKTPLKLDNDRVQMNTYACKIYKQISKNTIDKNINVI